MQTNNIDLVKLFLREYSSALFHSSTLAALDNATGEVKRLVTAARKHCSTPALELDTKTFAKLVGGYSFAETKRREAIIKQRVQVLLCFKRYRQYHEDKYMEDEMVFNRKMEKITRGEKTLKCFTAFDNYENRGRDVWSHILGFLA